MTKPKSLLLDPLPGANTEPAAWAEAITQPDGQPAWLAHYRPHCPGYGGYRVFWPFTWETDAPWVAHECRSHLLLGLRDEFRPVNETFVREWRQGSAEGVLCPNRPRRPGARSSSRT